MNVTIHDYSPQVIAKVEANAAAALRTVMEEVHKVSEPRTPMDTGQLRQRINKQVLGLKGTMTWQAKYAQYQERGYSSGPIRNYTTGGTGAHFAENAIKAVATPANFALHIRKVGGA